MFNKCQLADAYLQMLPNKMTNI